jgi:DNA-binding PadR family transcriptional regulator
MVRFGQNAPLTPAVFHILLALSTRERHGYGIMKQVEADSQGAVRMGPGTLYGSLKRMLEAGLVEESAGKIDPAIDDERRIYYRIAGKGRKALAAELERYRNVVAVAEGQRPLPNRFVDGYAT